MEEILTAFEYPYAWRALAASVMVGLMCGTLGCFIVLRNMAMFGDALSHAILPGIVVAFVIAGGYTALGFFLGSVGAGLLTAVAITWLQERVATKNDAAIGIVFTTMFALGVMGISWLSKNEHAHIDLKDFLFGNVLGVSDVDLWLTGLICAYVLASVWVFYRLLFATTFQAVIARTMGINVQLVHYFLMLLLSFAVVAALQTVGVILVVAMLITPAATGLLLSRRLPVVIGLAAGAGVVAAVTGLLIAFAFSTTPGPAMAVVASAIYALAVMFAPERGLVFRYLRQRRRTRVVELEDVLKQGLRLESAGELSVDALAERTVLPATTVRARLATLRRRGLATTSPLGFTAAGRSEGDRLVRAHRLYETFLVDRLGLTEDQIHDEAERYEHLLTADMLDEMDRELGYPELDPHGSPIPQREPAADEPPRARE